MMPRVRADRSPYRASRQQGRHLLTVLAWAWAVGWLPPMLPGAPIEAAVAPAEIPVDLEVNGSVGPVTIPLDSLVRVTWTAPGASDCRLMPIDVIFDGARAESGSYHDAMWHLVALEDPVPPTYTFVLTCTGPYGAFGTDSVEARITVSNNLSADIKVSGPGDLSYSDGPITVHPETSVS